MSKYNNTSIYCECILTDESTEVIYPEQITSVEPITKDFIKVNYHNDEFFTTETLFCKKISFIHKVE